MDGIEKGAGAHPGGMDDIFSMFAGGGHPGMAAQKRKARVKPIARRIDCTLNDVFTGNSFELKVDR